MYFFFFFGDFYLIFTFVLDVLHLNTIKMELKKKNKNNRTNTCTFFFFCNLVIVIDFRTRDTVLIFFISSLAFDNFVKYKIL